MTDAKKNDDALPPNWEERMDRDNNTYYRRISELPSMFEVHRREDGWCIIHAVHGSIYLPHPTARAAMITTDTLYPQRDVPFNPAYVPPVGPAEDAFDEQARQIGTRVGATQHTGPIANALRAAAAGRGPYGHISTDYPLSASEVERLGILAEECGEVVKAVGKILRFGWGNGQYDNQQQLEKELGGVSAAFQLLTATGTLSADRVDENAAVKLPTLQRLLRYT